MSTRLGRFITYIYRLTISLCFIVILALLCGYSGIMSAAFIDWEHTAYVKDNIFINLLAFFFTIALSICFRNTTAYKKLLGYIADDRHFFNLKNSLLLIIMLLGTVWALCTQFVPGVDEWEVMATVMRANRDEFTTFQPKAYMDWYPNQWGLFLFEYIFSQIFGSNNYLAFELLNAVAISMIYKQLSELAECMGMNRLGQLCILVAGILFFPTTLYSTMVYGNMLGVCLALAAVKYELYFFKNNYWKDATRCVICIAFAVFLKSNMLIYLLGIVFAAFVKTFERQKKDILVFMILVILAYLLQASAAQFAVETMSGYKMEKPISSWAFIAMGLQDGELAPGWWNESTVNSYLAHNGDVVAHANAAKESIKMSIEVFIEDPAYALEFFTQKITSTWANPTFQCFGTIRNGSYILTPKWVNWMLTYNGQYHLSKFLNLFCFIIYAGALVNAIWIFPKKDVVDQLVLPMVFIGGFIFHLFWETKARYATMYFVILIPYAICGYGRIASFVTNVIGSRKIITPTMVCRCLRNQAFPIVQCILVCTFVLGVHTGTDILTQDSVEYQDYLLAEQIELRMVPFNSNDLRSRQLNQAKSLTTYCAQLRNMEDITVAVAVRDIQGYCLRPDEVDMLEQLGFVNLDVLLDHTYHSFLGVSALGSDTYQKIGNDEIIQQSVTINNHSFQLTSATWQTGDVAQIAIDGVEWAVNKRGINFVVLDNSTGTIIDTVAFDTHVEGHQGYR